MKTIFQIGVQYFKSFFANTKSLKTRFNMNIDNFGNIGPKKDLFTQKLKKENRIEEIFSHKKEQIANFLDKIQTKYRLKIQESICIFKNKDQIQTIQPKMSIYIDQSLNIDQFRNTVYKFPQKCQPGVHFVRGRVSIGFYTLGFFCHRKRNIWVFHKY